MKKYGFVYIWRDRGKDRWYVGCHWGAENDRYICSSMWMRNSYRRRPWDFRRKILQTNISTKEELENQEYKWLQMIKKEELGKRYYNLKNYKFPLITNHSEETKKKISNHIPWMKGKHHSEETIQKIKEARAKQIFSEETKKLWSKQRKGNKSRTGMKNSEESNRKRSETQTGQKRGPYKPETKKRKPCTEATKEKIRQTKLANKY